MSPRVRYAIGAILIASVPFALMVLAGARAGLAAAEWYPWVLVAPLIDRLVRRTRLSGWSSVVTSVGQHLVQFLPFAVAHRSFVTVVVRRAYPEEAAQWPWDAPFQLVPSAIVYGALTAAFTIAESRRRQTEVAERLRTEVALARLDALRQQLNPHFLFNTLNHVVMQLRAGAVEPATRMVLTLSDLLRDVLADRGQTIPLSEELRIIERCLEIGRERFGERLHATLTIEPRALAAHVPTLLVQSLVENAMRHGLDGEGRCRMSLTARVVDDEVLVVSVTDAGPGLSSDTPQSSGIGLRNLAERLRMLYGDKQQFVITPAVGGGLEVSLQIPVRRS